MVIGSSGGRAARRGAYRDAPKLGRGPPDQRSGRAPGLRARHPDADRGDRPARGRPLEREGGGDPGCDRAPVIGLAREHAARPPGAAPGTARADRIAGSVVAGHEPDPLCREPVEEPRRVADLREPRTPLDVPVPDAEPSPPPEQLGEHTIGAGAVAGELERPLESAGRALATANDDVRLADLESPRMGVLGPPLGWEISRGDDRADRQETDQGVDQPAVPDVAEPRVEDEQVAALQLLANLLPPLAPVAVGEAAEVRVGMRDPVSEPLWQPYAEALDRRRPADERGLHPRPDRLGLRDRDVRERTGRAIDRAVPSAAGVGAVCADADEQRSHATACAIASRSSSEACHAPAAAFARTCSGLVAPAITEAMPGIDASPPTASSRMPRPRSAPTRSSASTASRSLASTSRPASREPAGARSPRRYLPVRSPLASGKYGT